ncbi:MAG: TIGR00268 family protein [Candidatus Omnitrophica bacterium CG11_big_fil_rev_8_21_14_0_20_63_9]|nr:MAG: TIGR00268 family protein [Candidatus Omnitrophica bacterium CG11_big_fil_rev_8_21_14_0_20_63_9]
MSLLQDAHSLPRELQQKCEQVTALLAGFRRVIVAYSGGVDSTLLAKLARDVLGKAAVLAVTADSPSLAREDLAEAIRLAQELDLQHLVIRTSEVQDLAYQANTPGRCYVCKRTLFVELEALARARGADMVLYGAIGDDIVSERPGERAASERGVRAPLQEVGLSKFEIRLLAQALGVPNWNRPQNACLSSRIPHGTTVTEDKLRQVEEAEAFLHAQGFHQVRVRHLGAHARIEVDVEAVGRFQDSQLRRAVTDRFAQLGFVTVSLDRAGYRAGGAQQSAVDEVLLSAIDKC